MEKYIHEINISKTQNSAYKIPNLKIRFNKYFIYGLALVTETVLVASFFYAGVNFGKSHIKCQNLDSDQIITLTKPTKVPLLTSDPTPFSSPNTDTKIDLPAITERTSNIDLSSWIQFIDNRGYTFYYPPGWYVSPYKNEAHTIMNWDPNSVTNPGIPMSSTNSKWDMGFDLQTFTSLEEIIQDRINNNPESDTKIDKIERSKLNNGQIVYFIEGTFAMFGHKESRDNFVDALIVNNDMYFDWHGYPSSNPNDLEVLKQMVESISKNIN